MKQVMPPNPTDGSVVAVENGKTSHNFICVFTDERNSSKIHQNVNGDTSVRGLYELVSQKLHCLHNEFVISYMEESDVDNGDVILDINCEESLSELLKESASKTQKFKVKIKDNDKILMNEPTTNAVQDSSEQETYTSDFFKLEGNNEETTQVNTSYSSVNYTQTNHSHTFKSGTGYVGLVNQAMTCYLNSLLQTLFMTPEFRNGLYRWRFKGTAKEETTSIPFQLQKLFLKLQTSKKRAVETTGLTKSFGWESGEAWQQHDVQELCRVMFDKLEETLKNTDQENLINQLYQGEMKDYVKCLKCDHENSRRDNYLDISVDVRPFGSKEPHENLEEALKAFVTPETLDGNNQYFCEKCNTKQDAHKGLKFLSFPYLLTIQLKRFTFDYNTLQRIKLPDKLMFPFKIDLNDLADQSSQDENTETGAKEKCECTDNEKENSTEEKITLDEKRKETIEKENPPSTDHSKGPYKYELFSILIHSGSAIGGHYYVYIKSFENQKWYCFNDQYVSEISEEDIKKSYGGSDRVGSGFTSNYSSSTNAYMLMYRQIKPSHNKGFVKQSEWSNSLEDLCKNILQEEHYEHNKKEYEKNICKVNLYAFHPVTKVKLDAKLEIHKNKTLSEATKIALELLDLQKVIPLSQCRLVKYDDYNSSFERSFEGCEEKQMIDILGAVRSTYGFDLLLECRKEDEEFSIYLPGGATLRVYLVDLEETEFDEPRTFHVPLSFTVKALKEFLGEKLHVSVETMRVAVCKDYHDFYLLGKDTKTLKNEGILKSVKLFVENSSEEDSRVNFKDSQLYRRLDVFKNSINIRLELPFTEEGTGEKKTLNLLIDKRITLSDLKNKISHHINTSPEQFRLYRTYSNNQEFECTRLNDQLQGYSDDTKMIVKLGRALKVGETRIKIYQLLLSEKEHIKFLMEGIISNSTTVKQLKEEQIIPELSKQGVEVTLKRCRLRKKAYKNPTHIYPDHYLFDEEPLRYANEFFVEILECDDEYTTTDDTSVYIRRWHPDTYVIDDFDEIVLHKKSTIAEFKQEIENKSDIPMEFISIAKGRSGSFPFKYSVLDIHHELDWDSVGHYVTDYPLAIREDGLLIYYRDSRDALKKLTEEEKSEIRKQERSKSPEAANSTKVYRKEKALKIYTNGEKR